MMQAHTRVRAREHQVEAIDEQAWPAWLVRRGRKPMAKRMRAKLREIKEQLMAIRHEGTERQGRWLCQVLRGWMAYLLCQ